MNRSLGKMMTTAGLLAALALPGALASRSATDQKADARSSAAPSTVADTPRPAPDPQMLAMLERLNALERDNDALKQQIRQRELKEIEDRRAQQAAMEQAERLRQAEAAAQAQAQTERGATPTPAPAASEPDLAVASRRELTDALLLNVVQSNDSPRQKALTAAAISLTTPRHELDHRLLMDLDPRTREQIARFHQMIAVTYDELMQDPHARLDRAAMIDRLDEVFGQQPLRVQHVELCRRVGGYGIYEPFAGHRFPAGQLNRMLVYVEIDDFVHQPTADDQYEVKVSVELELYDHRGEVMLWRQQPETITDVSRNQRRDFFLIQPVDLPASLGAGEFRLKVRVKDLHSGSLAESTISDLTLVADQNLAGQGR